jgi:hypothetical protein
MPRKSVRFLVAGLTMVLFWVASWMGKSRPSDLALAQNAGGAGERRTVIIKRDAVRVIQEDPYSTFNGVAVDEERGEVLVSNDNGNGQSIEAYHVEFPASRSDRVTEPLRKIAGPKADLGDICGLAISPEFREIFKVSGEGNSELAVFPIDANGDVVPQCVITGPKTGLGGGEGFTLSKALLYPPAKKTIFGGGATRAPKGQPGRQKAFTAIWKYADCGDVPPLYKLEEGSGVFDINPQAKEIIMLRGGAT